MQQAYHQQNDPSASGNAKEEIVKSHFITREGTYKLMTLSEYSRPNRVPLNPQQGGNTVGSAPVRVSFLTIPPLQINGGGDATTKQTAAADDASVNEDGYVAGRGVPGRTQPKLFNSYYSQYDEPPDEDDDDNSCCATAGTPMYTPDRICFNVGRELYVHSYRGVRAASDLNKPIDKRVYKGTFPTCHDFNQESATHDSCSLIIGFSAGQIQLIDPFRKDPQVSKLYNEDRIVDKTRLTCLRWVPGSPMQFLAAHASGQMYLYNEELPCSPGAPSYQTFKQGEAFTVYTCKTKSTRNPIYRWSIGDGAINEFAFSGSDAKMLATVSQDGFLRVFNYHSMELIGVMRSYFGGLLCVAWSPDTKYIVTGGEDDLINVYSVQEKRVVCRGQGHKSWISQVAFDPYTTWLGDGGVLPTTSSAGALSQPPLMGGAAGGDMGSDEELRPSSYCSSQQAQPFSVISTALSSAAGVGGGSLRSGSAGAFPSNILMRQRSQKDSVSSVSLGSSACYRIGSVGHDTQLCLWDLTDDVLKPPSRQRGSQLLNPSTASPSQPLANCFVSDGHTGRENGSGGGSGKSSKEGKENKKLHKRGFSFGSRLGGGGSRNANAATTSASGDAKGSSLLHPGSLLRGGGNSPTNTIDTTGETALRMLGTPQCPRMEEVATIEPLICKRIAHERLTVLAFRQDCIVTACQEGFICTWARPGRAAALTHQQSINSPNPGGSPNFLPGGTVV